MEPRDETLDAVGERLTALEGQLGSALFGVTKLLNQIAPDTRTLDERMAAVQLELENVPRRGHADVETKTGGNYSYDYILEADLMKGVRPLLAKHGIAVYYRDEILAYKEGSATVRVFVTFAAAGEERTISGDGFASDKGDKAANKAKTNAVRYLLWKTFLQPSDEDPELESTSPEQAAHAANARETAATRAARPRGGKTPEQLHGELIQRITTLSVERDEIQGKSPGSSLTELQDLIRLEHDAELSALRNEDLVAIGSAFGAHVTAERAKAEAGQVTRDDFVLPGGDA